VVRSVQRVKKNSFMDAVNMNKLALDMRPELLGSKAQKIRFWIDDVDVKVKKRLEERIKFIPTVVVAARAHTPTKVSPSKLKPQTVKASPSALALNKDEKFEEGEGLPQVDHASEADAAAPRSL